MVERRDREAPRYAATHPETASLAGVDQHGSAVTSQVSGPAVAGAEARGLAGTETASTPWGRSTRATSDSAPASSGTCSSTSPRTAASKLIGEGHGVTSASSIRPGKRARRTSTAAGSRRRSSLRSRVARAAAKSFPGRPRVEHGWPGARGQEEVEQKALTQRVSRADELRLGSPRARPCSSQHGLEQPAPADTEHLFAGLLLVSPAAPFAEVAGELRVCGHRRIAPASAARSPGGTSSVPLVGEELTRGRRVARDQGRAGGERLVRLVRDHAQSLVGGPRRCRARPLRPTARAGAPRS